MVGLLDFWVLVWLRWLCCAWGLLFRTVVAVLVAWLTVMAGMWCTYNSVGSFFAFLLFGGLNCFVNLLLGALVFLFDFLSLPVSCSFVVYLNWRLVYLFVLRCVLGVLFVLGWGWCFVFCVWGLTVIDLRGLVLSRLLFGILFGIWSFGVGIRRIFVVLMLVWLIVFDVFGLIFWVKVVG